MDELRLLPDVEGQGVPVGHQYPLPDVELVSMDELRLLDIFLADPLETFAFGHPEYLLQLTQHLNPSATRLPGRLHNPSIPRTIYAMLLVVRLQLFQDISSLPDVKLTASTIV